MKHFFVDETEYISKLMDEPSLYDKLLPKPLHAHFENQTVTTTEQNEPLSFAYAEVSSPLFPISIRARKE